MSTGNHRGCLCQVHPGDLDVLEDICTSLPSIPVWDLCTDRTFLISPWDPLGSFFIQNCLVSASILLGSLRMQ